MEIERTIRDDTEYVLAHELGHVAGYDEGNAIYADGTVDKEHVRADELKGKAGRALVTALGNAAEVFSEGTSGEGGTRLAGTVLEADAALPRARHMFP